MFWIVVVIVLALVLLVAWLHDRRAGSQPAAPPNDPRDPGDSGSLRLYRSGNSGVGL